MMQEKRFMMLVRKAQLLLKLQKKKLERLLMI
jgi:hypothetical protein